MGPLAWVPAAIRTLPRVTRTCSHVCPSQDPRPAPGVPRAIGRQHEGYGIPLALLRHGTHAPQYPLLVISYKGTGTYSASGGLFDIDGNNANSNTERFKIAAFDKTKTKLTEETSVHGKKNACTGGTGPAANNWNSWEWRFSLQVPHHGNPIKYIRIDFIGLKNTPKWGFDRFMAFGDQCTGVWRPTNSCLLLLM